MKKPQMFNVGDKVRCIDIALNNDLEIGREYSVTRTTEDGDDRYVFLEINGKEKGGFFQERFVLVEPETVEVPVEVPVRQLDMTYGGVGITLDPSAPFSRKFAEVFLDVIYGKGV